MNVPVCCILGDSISEGIGSRKLNYIPQLEALSGNRLSFVNLAKTGTTINHVFDIFDRIEACGPDVCIVMYGSVDAQIRANIWRNRGGLCSLIPRRYKQGGMLEPRAFYSRKWYRFVPDRMDNVVRFFIKRVVLATQGTVQWVTAEEFESGYRQVVRSLREVTKKVILVSTVFIDDRYFLGSSAEYRKFNGIISRIASEEHLPFVDLYSEMERQVAGYSWNSIYSFDHFHPNMHGYDLIAKMLWEALREADVFS